MEDVVMNILWPQVRMALREVPVRTDIEVRPTLFLYSPPPQLYLFVLGREAPRVERVRVLPESEIPQSRCSPPPSPTPPPPSP